MQKRLARIIFLVYTLTIVVIIIQNSWLHGRGIRGKLANHDQDYSHSPSFGDISCNYRPTPRNNYTENIFKSNGLIKNAKSYCDKIVYKTWNGVDRRWASKVVVDQTHEVIYVPVPKSATTYWKQTFAHILQINSDDSGYEIIPKRNLTLVHLNYFPRSMQRKMLKTYFKFTIVREPLYRLVSAFRDKFMYTKSSYYFKRYGKVIHINEDTFKDKLTNNNTSVTFEGITYTFRSFIRYLVNTSPREYNDHWGCYSTRVNPCYVKYDFIGKLETFENDFNFIYYCKLNQEHNETIFPPKHPSTVPSLFENFYSTVTDEDLIKVFRIFKLEYQMFQYDIPEIVEKASQRLILKNKN